MKIYTDDPRVKYVTTSISPERTREEISEVLRAYDTSDILWHWKPEFNDVFVQFGVEEVIDEVHARVIVKVVMPVLWDKAVQRSPDPKRRVEHVNLRVSMRGMYYYILNNLQNAYVMQSSRVASFLPDLVTPSGERYFERIKRQLDQFGALPEPKREPPRHVEVILPSRVVEADEVIVPPKKEGQP
ncbi:MAG: hypothetical protein ACQCN6_01855 [Candidatus Bathyarchaeia archaeon]|jgi:hypothetical protein